MKKVRLKDIASIRIGYAFRRGVKHDPDGSLGFVQMKDINEYNQVDWIDIYRVEIENVKLEHLLKKNDILFRSRGVSNTAALITIDFNEQMGDCVASEGLTVIRLRSERVIAGYVAWYINQPQGQYQLKRLAKGSSLLAVSNTELGELKIDLPPPEIQLKIAAVAALSIREKQLLDQLTLKRQLYISAALDHQIQVH